jgi:signal peptide peptidase SppA
MEITDFSKGTYWAIHPKSLNKMIETLPDFKNLAKEVIKFTSEPKERDDFMLRDGVAVIPVAGPLSKRMSFWSWLFGGMSFSRLTEVFNAALADPDVEAILLDIDSPGGTVNGTEAFGDLVYSARDVKPVVAFGNGMMTSAAYWIGSGAQKVFVEKTTDVGSIGVVMVHLDWSKFDEKMGVKRTVLSSGKYKALGNDSQPLSDLAKETFQQELDYLYTQFVDTVARNRGADSKTVLEDMADGRVFIGQQAVDAGLADGTGSLDTAIEAALDLIPEPEGTYFYYQTNKAKEGVEMKDKMIAVPKTTKELVTAFPEMAQELIQQGADSVKLDEAVTLAVKDESDRVVGLAVAQFGEVPGDAFKKVVESGVTVEQFTAIQGAQPKGKKGASTEEQILEQIQAVGAEDVGTDTQTGGPSKPFMEQVTAYASANNCSQSVAIGAIMVKDPKAHEAYIQSVNPGKALS